MPENYGEPLQSVIAWLRATHEGTLSGERIELVLDALDSATRHAASGWEAARRKQTMTVDDELRLHSAIQSSVRAACPDLFQDPYDDFPILVVDNILDAINKAGFVLSPKETPNV